MQHVQVTWKSAAEYLTSAFCRQVAIELPNDDSDRYEVVKAQIKIRGKWFELRGSTSTAHVQTNQYSDIVDIYLYSNRR